MTKLWKPLHHQTLDQVEAMLHSNNSAAAEMVLETLSNGSVEAINEKTLREAKSNFGPSMWDAPVLAGPEVSLWEVLPTLDDLRRIIKEEMLDQPVSMVPSEATQQEDVQVALQLLDHLEDPRYPVPGSIHSLISPRLTASLPKGSKSLQGWADDGILEVTPLIVNVMPAFEAYDLGHCEGYMLNTLLSGTKIWIIYPPTESNLVCLREKWEDFATNEEYYSVPFWKRMTAGIAVIQRAGQTLHIPPFCPYLMCSLETSVSAEYWIITAKKFTLRLQNTRIVLAQNLCEHASVRQRKLIQFADSISTDLNMILNEVMDKFDTVQTIIKICRIWAETKDNVRAMCEAIEDPAASAAMVNKFKGAWVHFLEQKKKKSGRCRLCQLQIKEMGLNLADHFHMAHWKGQDVVE